VLLLVARLDAARGGFDPDLQEVGRVLRGMIELAVHHATARAHALHVARPDDATARGVACSTRLPIAHAVLVRQLARDHVAHDLHVTVAVRAEAGAGRDAVFVDDAQVAEAHLLRVVVVGERETVKALQPAVVGIAAVR